MIFNISQGDVILVSPGTGVGVNMSNIAIPFGAKDRDQFTAKISVFTKDKNTNIYDIVLEVAPESVSTMGKKIPRHLHGFIQGDISLEELSNSSCEVENIQPSAGFTLIGVV